jgi:proton-dependent oligopeptide transporter, POT family
VIPAWIESQIAAGRAPNIVWQLLAYVVITAAEVLVSITCLEFSYTQAPKKMKSLVMSIYNLSVFVGNLFTSMVNKLIQNPDGTVKLTGPDYYLFFAGVMLVASVIFIAVAYYYREQTYIQDEVA